MRSIATGQTFPLASVKPLDGLLKYRAYCLEATRRSLAGPRRRRERSPVGETGLDRFGEVEGLEYLRCPETGSLFLAEVAPPPAWARLLADVSRYRRSPDAFHTGIARSRNDTVYAPKLEWIESTLRLQGLSRPRLLEVVSPPSDFRPLLEGSRALTEVVTVDEMEMASVGAVDPAPGRWNGAGTAEVAVLLESLDRVDDPAGLLRAVAGRLIDGGLVFVTALVASGFDVTVLGLDNLYLYPPDRTNCFTLRGLDRLLRRAGFVPLEVSTPGVLDVEIVQAHQRRNPAILLSAFEQQLLDSEGETHAAFQSFLQQSGLSSFARLVARKGP